MHRRTTEAWASLERREGGGDQTPPFYKVGEHIIIRPTPHYFDMKHFKNFRSNKNSLDNYRIINNFNKLNILSILSNQTKTWIVITIFRLILKQAESSLVPEFV